MSLQEELENAALSQNQEKEQKEKLKPGEVWITSYFTNMGRYNFKFNILFNALKNGLIILPFVIGLTIIYLQFEKGSLFNFIYYKENFSNDYKLLSEIVSKEMFQYLVNFFCSFLNKVFFLVNLFLDFVLSQTSFSLNIPEFTPFDFIDITAPNSFYFMFLTLLALSLFLVPLRLYQSQIQDKLYNGGYDIGFVPLIFLWSFKNRHRTNKIHIRILRGKKVKITPQIEKNIIQNIFDLDLSEYDRKEIELIQVPKSLFVFYKYYEYSYKILGQDQRKNIKKVLDEKLVEHPKTVNKKNIIQDKKQQYKEDRHSIENNEKNDLEDRIEELEESIEDLDFD